MPLPFVIDALRQLAPSCPDGELVLLEAAERLTQLCRALAQHAPSDVLSEWQIPAPEPTR